MGGGHTAYQKDSHGQIIVSANQEHDDPPPTERYVGPGDFPDAMPYLLCCPAKFRLAYALAHAAPLGRRVR